MRLLIIGGSGVLGTELIQQLTPLAQWDAPSHNELDICKSDSIDKWIQGTQYDEIVLLAGEKDQLKIELDSHFAIQTNIMGVANVVDAIQRNKCQARLIYVSTGYVYKGNQSYHKEDDGLLPCNKYAWSKLSGECTVRMLDEKRHLIIRCEFSKAPWHRNYAFIDQYTSREEVKITAYKIYGLIIKEATGTYNIGGKRRNVYQYAKSLDKSGKISKCKMKDFATVPLPYDSSLNTSKYDKFMGGKDDKTA
jgi:dTDP-4-dehydrorhamnose reductase